MATDNNNGWVKLHRSLLQWEWWDEPNVARLFIYCLLKANPADRRWKGQIIERGSFITSRSHLAVGTGLSEQQVRSALAHLQSTGEITSKTTNKNTKITICNYDKYQATQPTEQPAEQPTNNHNEEYKEIKEIKNNIISIKEKNKKEKSQNPTLEEIQAYCREKNYAMDAEEFFNYYESNGWRVGKNPMKNWKAAVANWMKREREYGAGKKKGLTYDERHPLGVFTNTETTTDF